jgi:hypothetical protein
MGEVTIEVISMPMLRVVPKVVENGTLVRVFAHNIPIHGKILHSDGMNGKSQPIPPGDSITEPFRVFQRGFQENAPGNNQNIITLWAGDAHYDRTHADHPRAIKTSLRIVQDPLATLWDLLENETHPDFNPLFEDWTPRFIEWAQQLNQQVEVKAWQKLWLQLNQPHILGLQNATQSLEQSSRVFADKELARQKLIRSFLLNWNQQLDAPKLKEARKTNLDIFLDRLSRFRPSSVEELAGHVRRVVSTRGYQLVVQKNELLHERFPPWLNRISQMEAREFGKKAKEEQERLLGLDRELEVQGASVPDLQQREVLGDAETVFLGEMALVVLRYLRFLSTRFLPSTEVTNSIIRSLKKSLHPHTLAYRQDEFFVRELNTFLHAAKGRPGARQVNLNDLDPNDILKEGDFADFGVPKGLIPALCALRQEYRCASLYGDDLQTTHSLEFQLLDLMRAHLWWSQRKFQPGAGYLNSFATAYRDIRDLDTADPDRKSRPLHPFLAFVHIPELNSLKRCIDLWLETERDPTTIFGPLSGQALTLAENFREKIQHVKPTGTGTPEGLDKWVQAYLGDLDALIEKGSKDPLWNSKYRLRALLYSCRVNFSIRTRSNLGVRVERLEAISQKVQATDEQASLTLDQMILDELAELARSFR